MIVSFAGIYENVAYCILRLKLLVLANDIETNPGPEFSLAVQGSFLEGALKYGEVGRSQCAVITFLCIMLLTKSCTIILDKGNDG